jgi:DNA-binding NarL/FixJ family response regulator
MDHSVLLLEPNDILRKGLSCQLAQTRRIRITEVANVERALRAAERESFTVAIIGLGIAGDERHVVVERIRRACADTACIVIVRGDRRLEIERAVCSQATGILCSESPCQELWSAIESVLSGRQHVSRFLQHGLLASLRAVPVGKAPSVTALTGREQTILCRISRGETNDEIAADLGLSRRTVDTHRQRLMQKLGLHRAAQLVRFAVREGLVEA